MQNSFVNLPIPGVPGAGAAIDVSQMGTTKTLTLEGDFKSGAIHVEISNDAAGIVWAPLFTFTEADAKPFDVAAHYMRAVNVNYDGTVPVLDVGGTSDGAMFVEPPCPAVTGVGADTDIAAFPPFKTIVVSAFDDGAVYIEISDGTSDSQVIMSFFPSDGAQKQSLSFVAQTIRARREGNGAVTVAVAGSNSAGTGDGAGDNVFVFNPFNPPGYGTYNDADLLEQDMQAVPGYKILQFDNTRSGEGLSLTFTAPSTVRLERNPDEGVPFAADMVGRNIVIDRAISPANNGTFVVSAVIDADTLEFQNFGGVTEAFHGAWVVVGGGGTNDIVFPPSGLNESWDMTMVEWTAYAHPFQSATTVARVIISDPTRIDNLRKIGGELQVVNRSSIHPVKIIGNAQFELGLGITGDPPTIFNDVGAAPFFDCRALLPFPANQFQPRMQGTLTGPTACIDFGTVLANGVGGAGTSIAVAATVVTFTVPTPQFDARMVERVISITNATNAGNNGAFLVTAVLSPTQLQYVNVAAVNENPFNAGGTWSVGASPGLLNLNMTTISRIASGAIIGGNSLTTINYAFRAAICEINRQDVYLGRGTGDNFAVAAGVVTLTDAAGLFTAGMVGRAIVITGATSTGNNGMYFVTAFLGPTQVQYANPDAVAEAFAGTWTVGSPFPGNIQYGSQGSTTLGGTNIPRQPISKFPVSLNQQMPIKTAAAFNTASGLGHNSSFKLNNAIAINQPLPLIRVGTSVPIGSFGSVDGSLNSTGLRTTIIANGVGAVNVLGSQLANGVGDDFAVAAGLVTLTDAAGLFTAGMVGRAINIAGAVNAGNNGSFLITAFLGPTQVQFLNGAAVAELASPATWIVGDTINGGTAAFAVPSGTSVTFESDGVSNWDPLISP